MLPFPLLAAVTIAASAVTVVDDVGRTVVLQRPPSRIVSTAPSNTEALFALGVGDRVVGVTTYCDSPPEARERAHIGDFSTIDLERVVALEPDLVVATWLEQKRYVERMEALGLNVLVLFPESLADTLHSLETLGRAIGRADEAAVLVADLTARLARIDAVVAARDRRRSPRVFVQLSATPLYSAGPGSTVDEAISRAGGRNIAHDLGKPYGPISRELVIARDPDIILVGNMAGAEGDGADDLANAPGFAGITAVVNGRVHAIDPGLLFHQNQRLVEGIEALATLFAPPTAAADVPAASGTAPDRRPPTSPFAP